MINKSKFVVFGNWLISEKVYDDVLLVNRISAQLEKFFLFKTIKLYAQILPNRLPVRRLSKKSEFFHINL